MDLQVEPTEQLVRLLKTSAHQALGQCGYPAMPKNYHLKLHAKATELSREVAYGIIAIKQAYSEIKDYAFFEFNQIYLQDY